MPLTLEELAIHVPGAIAVFEEYDLDYYQNGSRTIRAACAEKGLSFKEVDERLSCLNDSSGIILPRTLADLSPDLLIDYINGRFHASEEDLLQWLHAQLRLGTYNPSERKVIRLLEPAFTGMKERLLVHCRKEDELLFPWMRQLVILHKTRALKRGSRALTLVRNPLELLKKEHAAIVALLQSVKHIAHNFNIPASATPSYKLLILRFRDFETDFHMHLHIENNILFPKLLTMEQSLFHS